MVRASLRLLFPLVWLLELLLVVALALLLAAWIWSGTAGSRVNLAGGEAPAYLPAGQTLDAQDVKGSIRKGGQIGLLHWSANGLTVSARDVQLEWQPLDPLRRRLNVSTLKAGELVVDDRRPASPSAPEPPPEILLPLDIDLALAVDTIRLTGATAFSRPMDWPPATSMKTKCTSCRSRNWKSWHRGSTRARYGCRHGCRWRWICSSPVRSRPRWAMARRWPSTHLPRPTALWPAWHRAWNCRCWSSRAPGIRARWPATVPCAPTFGTGQSLGAPAGDPGPGLLQPARLQVCRLTAPRTLLTATPGCGRPGPTGWPS